jgi:hypothetical protein
MDLLQTKRHADRGDLLSVAFDAVERRDFGCFRPSTPELVPEDDPPPGVGEGFERLEIIVTGARAPVHHKQGGPFARANDPIPHPAAGNRDTTLLGPSQPQPPFLTT